MSMTICGCRYYLEQFIESIPIESDKKAEKLLRVCHERDMVDSS